MNLNEMDAFHTYTQDTKEDIHTHNVFKDPKEDTKVRKSIEREASCRGRLAD